MVKKKTKVKNYGEATKFVMIGESFVGIIYQDQPSDGGKFYCTDYSGNIIRAECQTEEAAIGELLLFWHEVEEQDLRVFSE